MFKHERTSRKQFDITGSSFCWDKSTVLIFSALIIARILIVSSRDSTLLMKILHEK